ncbi:hypothetical protein F5Y15DRAFT_411482 [Xylariaceae sp. FL0016]|nr:hypothetical protein F5Y15DRAFT_411482 [Xylariaceae sp. FL0016]
MISSDYSSSSTSTPSSPSSSSVLPSSSAVPSTQTSSTSSTSSVTSTSSSSTKVFVITTGTEFPTYTAPTATITGAAETSSVIAIAPLFTAVWRNRGNLANSETKEEYIKDVTNTKNQVDSLFNNLSIKPDPPSKCSGTGGSGSLITGIMDILDTPAKLISCAQKVVGNLVDIVNEADPVIATVEVLTDTLRDIGEALETEDQDDPTSSSTSSKCLTRTVQSCIVTTTLSTSWYADSTTTTSTVKTISTSSCASITGCSVQATTATTTTSTSTSSAISWVCDAICAASQCAAKRWVDTTATADISPSQATAPSLQRRNLKPTGMIPNVDSYIINTMKGPSAEGLDWGKLTVVAVAQFYQFLNRSMTRFVAGVTG